MRYTRRKFIKKTGKVAMAGLLAGLPARWVGAVYADDSPETKQIRFGMIRITFGLERTPATTLSETARNYRISLVSMILPSRTRAIRFATATDSMCSRFDLITAAF